MLPNLKQTVSALVTKFIKFEDQRLKNVCSDVGAMLASFTVFQKSINLGDGSNTNTGFVDSYLDEVFLRCVMWWRKSSLYVDSKEIFMATKVSRDITLFQLMFLQCVIGEDLSATTQLLDDTNGKAPKSLESFQKAWKEAQKNVIDWSTFLDYTKCSQNMKETITRDPNKWIQTCVARAKARGKAYGF